MKGTTWQDRLKTITTHHKAIVERKNEVDPNWVNGWYERYKYPVLTNEHVPLHWRYDLNPDTNPYLIERLGSNGVYNAGAIEWEGKIYIMARVEGFDRKSFFALAVSDNGIDNFRFIGEPIVLDQTADPDVNVYDMRLVQHEDGYVYGIFCSERKDPSAPPGNTSMATAQAGMVRTKDMKKWERLPDLKTQSPQQRNVVLHPEFINGKYAFYTRPQDGFISTGSGGGIGWTLADSMENPVTGPEQIIDPKVYHTIKEVKNGMGAAPFKTKDGWLHIDHGVRECAAGLRYVIYSFLCDLKEPWKVTHRPSGYFIAPQGEERIGDVSNVVFINGMVLKKDGTALIYYASSDTRLHVAKSHIDILLDYVKNTPEDPLFSHLCAKQRAELCRKNVAFIEKSKDAALKTILNG